ncbi:MAG TPA: hypothetical protein VFF69_10855 [Phycisphaerales bacterium]|nr:hypothetical protein [Phycisphaerales bacterium]
MSSEPSRQARSETLLIGPGVEPWDPSTTGPDCGAEPPQVSGRKLVLRLVVAFFLLAVVALACFVAPKAGIPPWVPLAAFGVIAVSVLINARPAEESPEHSPVDDRSCGRDDGRPVGCCPGPRPPGFLRPPDRGR